jgi:hypothetical protein
VKKITAAFALAGSLLALPATDSLKRSAGTLGANWSSHLGAVTDWTLTVGEGANPTYGGADFSMHSWNADSFSDDQYSEAKLDIGANGYVGVAVRMSGSDGTREGYAVTLESGCTIYKWDGGTKSGIGSCSVTWTDGHTLRLSVSGTSITVTDNGSPIGSATDSAVTTGAPGIVGYSSSVSYIYDWQADNVGGSPASFIPALINAPIRGGGVRAFLRF